MKRRGQGANGPPFFIGDNSMVPYVQRNGDILQVEPLEVVGDRIAILDQVDVLPTPKGEGFCFNGDAPEWVLLPLHMSRRPYSEHG